VVIAIITLLIGILLPSLSGARDQAKRATTRNTLKVIADGLELFRNENEVEFHGYPPSTAAEDQTEQNAQIIFGAQWLVRYLMGKDLNGYVPRRAVPSRVVEEAPDNWKQKGWYDLTGTEGQPYDRVGPYVQPEKVKVVRPDQLMGKPEPGAIAHVDEASLRQLVVLDAFGFPILYYCADPRQAARPNAYIARYDETTTYQTPDGVAISAIYTFKDNALFTGMSTSLGGNPDIPPWDLTGDGKKHEILYFGPEPPDANVVANEKRSFVYYILDKNAYDATRVGSDDSKRTVTPYRRDSFLLITPGKDGLYGTLDDVNNF